MTDFSDWDACKLGIIDKNGEKLKHPVSSKERESWDILTRFCWNIKKISMKFIGKSKFSQYFTAAYLLKDSFSTFYINKNKERLDESILSDMTFTKQNFIHSIIKQLPEAKCSNEDQLEFMIFKYITIVEKVLKDNPQIYEIFNEEAPAVINTTTADITGVSQYLGLNKRTKKTKKAIKKDLSKIIKSKKGKLK